MADQKSQHPALRPSAQAAARLDQGATGMPNQKQLSPTGRRARNRRPSAWLVL